MLTRAPRIALQSYQVPTGHTPRAMNVYARGNATRQANPGDEVTITGAFLPAVEGGWRQLRSGLLATTFLEAYEIVQEKATAGAGEADEEHAEQVVEISQGVWG
jgi:DNA replication licensing factor MCM7